MVIKIVAMQAGKGSWADYNDDSTAMMTAFDSRHVQFKPPAGPSPHPWHFRLQVSEELKGVERIFLGTEAYAGDVLEKLRNGRKAPLGAWVGFNKRTLVFGHQTEIIVGEGHD
jgi:hypothetical protein